MSKIVTVIDARCFLELTEGKAEALAAICGYGTDEFKKWFYRNMGKHYLQPFEKHLDTLFDKARKLDYAVKQVKDARKTLTTISI